MITSEQFKRGVDIYFTSEVFPKLPEGKRFVAAFGTALLVGNATKHPIVQQLGLVSDDGMIDIERAYEAARSAANVAPLVLDLPIVGVMKFTAQDIEQMYRTLLNA